MFGAPLIVVLFIALVLFGPDKLPGIARQLGKVMSDFRRIADDTMNALQEESKPTRPAAKVVKRTDLEEEGDI